MVNELNDSYCGESIQMKGWVYNTRSIGKIWFLIFRDGTGLIQGVVVKNEASEKTFGLESKLNQEDSIIIEGIVRKENRSATTGRPQRKCAPPRETLERAHRSRHCAAADRGIGDAARTRGR